MKLFPEVFPKYRASGSIAGLVNQLEVDRIAASEDLSGMEIWLTCPCLAEHETFRELEKDIASQLFPGKRLWIRIHETFRLSGNFSPERLFDAYKDSIFRELQQKNLIAYRDRLLALDETLREGLSGTQRKVIIFHEALPYFAEACGLTQSTLSLMVKKLEEELDVRIFDRDSHPVAPTGIGCKIIERARIVLYNAGQIAEMTRSEKEILSGPLRIAIISTVASVLVPGLFKYIGAQFPAISLQTEEMLTSTVKEKLRKAEADMGLLTGPVDDTDLLEIPLYHERFLAYVSPQNPAYARESIRYETVFNQPVWIIRDGLRQLDPSELGHGEEVTYERFFEGGRVGTLIQVVNDNGGMTIIPETHSKLIMFSR